jgi:hypothetical protein
MKSANVLNKLRKNLSNMPCRILNNCLQKSLDPIKWCKINVKEIVCAILNSLTHLVSHGNGKFVAASLPEKLCLTVLIITATSPGNWMMKQPAVASLAGE